MTASAGTIRIGAAWLADNPCIFKRHHDGVSHYHAVAGARRSLDVVNAEGACRVDCRARLYRVARLVSPVVTEAVAGSSSRSLRQSGG
jgi:hypothetical protein